MSDNIIFAGAYKNDIEPATIIEIINIALENLLLNYTKTGDIMELLIIAMIAIIILIIAAIAKDTNLQDIIIEPGKKRAGRQGETVAINAIKSVLSEDDLLFSNVEISFEDKLTELDNVIVNRFGVFIVEVKNYKGILYGNEDDYQWKKYKDDSYGNTFEKSVKNPIKQVKRQVYILSKFLEYYGSRVWVEGYALLIQGNSPVRSMYILSNISDIDRAIHTPGRSSLSKQQIENISKLIQRLK